MPRRLAATHTNAPCPYPVSCAQPTPPVTFSLPPQVLQQPQYRGKALPADHPDSKLVQKIAEHIIAAVEEGHGGGFQKHIEKFDWEVGGTSSLGGIGCLRCSTVQGANCRFRCHLAGHTEGFAC